MVSIGGGLQRFVPVDMVVGRGDVTGASSFSNISVLQSILLHCIVCLLGGEGS
jgi:hypothetical protein